jgi:hypothetical protein
VWYVEGWLKRGKRAKKAGLAHRKMYRRQPFITPHERLENTLKAFLVGPNILSNRPRKVTLRNKRIYINVSVVRTIPRRAYPMQPYPVLWYLNTGFDVHLWTHMRVYPGINVSMFEIFGDYFLRALCDI